MGAAGLLNKVDMQCRHCGFRICDEPEAFLKERRCPKCLRITVFLRPLDDVPVPSSLPRRAAVSDVAAASRPGPAPHAGRPKSGRSKGGRAHWLQPVPLLVAALILSLLATLVFLVQERRKADNLGERLAALDAVEAASSQLEAEYARQVESLLARGDRQGLAELRETLRAQHPRLPVRSRVEAAYAALLLDALAESREARRELEAGTAAVVSETRALQARAAATLAKAEDMARDAGTREAAARAVLAREGRLREAAESLAAREARLNELEARVTAMEKGLALRQATVEKREHLAQQREDQITKMLASLSSDRQPPAPQVIVVPSAPSRPQVHTSYIEVVRQAPCRRWPWRWKPGDGSRWFRGGETCNNRLPKAALPDENGHFETIGSRGLDIIDGKYVVTLK